MQWHLIIDTPNLMDSFLLWQHYIVDIDLEKVEQDEGFEVTGIPEGIPSQAEYLAEYCSAAVRPMLRVFIGSQFWTHLFYSLLGNYRRSCKEHLRYELSAYRCWKRHRAYCIVGFDVVEWYPPPLYKVLYMRFYLPIVCPIYSDSSLICSDCLTSNYDCYHL